MYKDGFGKNFGTLELKEFQMSEVIELIERAANFPIEYVFALVSLAAIGLAAFAIHAVHSMAKRKGD